MNNTDNTGATGPKGPKGDRGISGKAPKHIRNKDRHFIPHKGPETPPRKPRADPLADIAEKCIDHIKTSMFAKWLLPILRETFNDQSSSFKDLVDRACDGENPYRVEEEVLDLPEESTHPVLHYMFLNSDNVVLSGLKMTHEQIMDELAKLQKIADKRAIAEEDAEDGDKEVTDPADPSDG